MTQGDDVQLSYITITHPGTQGLIHSGARFVGSYITVANQTDIGVSLATDGAVSLANNSIVGNHI